MKNKFKISREVLLKLADNNSYSEEILKKECPKLFKSELKVNNYYWVKHTSLENALVFIQGKDVTHTYGFSHYFEFTDMYRNDLLHTTYKSDIIRKATPQEVETALINEAKKRALTPNNLKNINCLEGYSKERTQTYYNNKTAKFEYEKSTNTLWLINGSFLSICIFNNGTWSEIIETPTDIITIVEKYGKDKLIKLIEKM